MGLPDRGRDQRYSSTGSESFDGSDEAYAPT